ncbi:MAG: DUF5683 domain-containing protein [Candidatus Neomarinimicrobiota bacterium]|nr:DUF5683 domain-containing protein [Candidatus Neomarinimicrobiota bacterium]
MSRIIRILIFVFFISSVVFPQKKMDFRSESEQLKDPKTAMKRSLVFPGAGQIYNDQNIKGYALIAGEILALWSFNENREKYSNYEESDKYSRNHYLRERNRFAWIAIGLYFYGILDAVVEAHLDDFDRIVKENDPMKEEDSDEQ